MGGPGPGGSYPFTGSCSSAPLWYLPLVFHRRISWDPGSNRPGPKSMPGWPLMPSIPSTTTSPPPPTNPRRHVLKAVSGIVRARGAPSRWPRSTAPPGRAALTPMTVRSSSLGTHGLTVGLISPGTGTSSKTEGACSERPACERGFGSRQLDCARRGLDDQYGHLSRLRLSEGRPGPMCVLPSRASALALLRPAATAGRRSHSIRSESIISYGMYRFAMPRYTKM
jgi:hypothetical protein